MAIRLLAMGALLASTALLVCGCTDIGAGTGAVMGAVYIQECAEHEVGSEDGKVYSFGTLADPETYNMHPTFFAAEPINDFQELDPVNQLELRVQSDGSNIEQADVLFINVADDLPIAQMVGQAIPIGPATNVRASLNLNQSCPDPEVVPTLEGTLTFSSFGSANPTSVPPDFNIEIGDRIAATFDLTIVDTRAATLGGEGAVPITPAVGGSLSGFFDFVVRRGQSLQSFP